jgi:hypothetical protein
MKICKSCKSEIADDAKKCPQCRADQRNWFGRHKILTVLLAIILLGIIATALGGGSGKDSNNPGSGSSDNTKDYRFDDRADKQAKDQEIIPKESATVDGRQLTVTSIDRTSSLGEFSKAADGKVFVVANVTIKNTSDKTQTYNVFDFRIQTAGGTVVDPYIGGNNDLNSGDLVAGGKVTGNVTFEVPVETANQYIIYKPNSAISDRVIVQAKQ